MADKNETRPPCNAPYQGDEGGRCELHEAHVGTHRFGRLRSKPVVFWSTPDDAATRPELVAEAAWLTHLLSVAPVPSATGYVVNSVPYVLQTWLQAGEPVPLDDQEVEFHRVFAAAERLRLIADTLLMSPE